MAAHGATASGKASLRQRAVSELERYAVITAYLWVLFALFSLHRQLLQGHGISLWHQGFALINALVFGKVILLAQALEVGKGLENNRALVWVVLGKALILALLLIVFHIAEEAVRGWLRDEPLSVAFADFGGTLPGLLSYAGIFFVSLIPLLAFQEVARVLGGDALHELFFRRNGNRLRLVEDVDPQ